MLQLRPLFITSLLVTAAVPVMADLPEGPGKAATVRVCGTCHSPERAASMRQNHSAWEDTITKMVKLGAQGSDEEFEAILAYLTNHFGPVAPAPIAVNTARVVDLEIGLTVRRSQARAIVAYREANGNFKSLDDLRRVPGLDMQKVEARKTRLVF